MKLTTSTLVVTAALTATMLGGCDRRATTSDQPGATGNATSTAPANTAPPPANK